MPTNWFEKYRNSQNIILCLCICIAFTIFWWPLANTWFILLLTIYWLFFTNKQISSKNEILLIFGFTLIYAFVLIGLFYSENKTEGLFRIQQKSSLLLFPLIFGTSRFITSKSITAIILTFSISAALMCIYFLSVQTLNILFDQPAAFTGYNLIAFPQMSPSAFTTMSLFAFICLLYYLFNQSDQFDLLKRYLTVAGALAIFITLLLAGNRISILLACIILVIIALRAMNNKLFIFPLLIALSLLIFLNYNYLQKRFQTLWFFSNNSVIRLDVDSSLGRSWDGSSIRLAIWSCSFDLIRQHSLKGLGTGDVQDQLQQTYEKRKFYFASRYNNYNAHNQYIQQLLSNGILGLFSLLLAISIGFYFAFKQKNALYFYFLSTFAIICFTESFLEINKGIFFYSFFNSLFAFTKK